MSESVTAPASQVLRHVSEPGLAIIQQNRDEVLPIIAAQSTSRDPETIERCFPGHNVQHTEGGVVLGAIASANETPLELLSEPERIAMVVAAYRHDQYLEATWQRSATGMWSRTICREYNENMSARATYDALELAGMTSYISKLGHDIVQLTKPYFHPEYGTIVMPGSNLDPRKDMPNMSIPGLYVWLADAAQALRDPEGFMKAQKGYLLEEHSQDMLWRVLHDGEVDNDMVTRYLKFMEWQKAGFVGKRIELLEQNEISYIDKLEVPDAVIEMHSRGPETIALIDADTNEFEGLTVRDRRVHLTEKLRNALDERLSEEVVGLVLEPAA